jgi:hypothetical protein
VGGREGEREAGVTRQQQQKRIATKLSLTRLFHLTLSPPLPPLGSFTTLSLLLALGENLETPFRVMDEFDVFMDAVARKIALDTLVQCASAMVHRQFIFITPQDVSSLTVTPMLKIIKMRPPDRNGGQTTID